MCEVSASSHVTGEAKRVAGERVKLASCDEAREKEAKEEDEKATA